jgi:hypothetical protein
MITLGELDQAQRALLKWLSKDVYSLLGECEGQALDHLVDFGLATVTLPPPHRDRGFGSVRLTPAGEALAARIEGDT